MPSMNEHDEAKTHVRWNGELLRVLLDEKEIEALPVQVVSVEELYKKMRSIYWNGCEHYPITMKMLPGEVGYDRESRYICHR